jgi:hypothetical protein
MTSDQVEFNQFLADLSSKHESKNAKDTISFFIEKCTDISSVDGYIKLDQTPSTGYGYMFPMSANSTTNIFSTLTSNYTTPLPALGPAEDNTVISKYIDSMLDVFSMVFYMVYNVLSTAADVGGSQYKPKLPANLNFPSFNTKVQSLCATIFQFDAFTTSMSLDEYIEKITANLYDPTINTVFTEPLQNQLFIICFYPFFTYKYICNFIVPSPKLSAADKGSRNVYVRRAAIMSIYMFHAYFFFSFYGLSARISPSSDFTTKLRQLLDSNAIHPFTQESLMDNDQLDALDGKTNAAFEITSRIEQTNREIEMSRTNINTVIFAEPKMNARLKRAKIAKWIWFSLFVVYVLIILIFCIILIQGKAAIGVPGIESKFLNETGISLEDFLNKVASGGNIVSALFIIVLCISGIIYASKKF